MVGRPGGQARGQQDSVHAGVIHRLVNADARVDRDAFGLRHLRTAPVTYRMVCLPLLNAFHRAMHARRSWQPAHNSALGMVHYRYVSLRTGATMTSRQHAEQALLDRMRANGGSLTYTKAVTSSATLRMLDRMEEAGRVRVFTETVHVVTYGIVGHGTPSDRGYLTRNAGWMVTRWFSRSGTPRPPDISIGSPSDA